MSFHVVRHEHPTILVMNRQTYETYRFTIGDDVALAHVGPPCDLAKARSAGRPWRFWLRGNAKTRPVADPQPERDGSPISGAQNISGRSCEHCHHDR
jgi:hypothetical protein